LQTDFFDEYKKNLSFETIHYAIDSINKKFHGNVVHLASSRTKKKPKKEIATTLPVLNIQIK
jgi:hypothetical protein